MVSTTVSVSDITGRENHFKLDTHGFQLCRHEVKSQCRDDGYTNNDMIKAQYYSEIEQLLRAVTGASRVVIFDYKTRHGPTNWHSLGAGNQSVRSPILRAHVNQSYAGAEFMAWRPIKTVYQDPLGVADATTIAEEDLVPARIIYEDHERVSWTVKASPKHRWYFKYAQRPGEVLLIKCCDSRLDVARRAPHSASQDPRHVHDAWSQSIEIRTMVFYDE